MEVSSASKALQMAAAASSSTTLPQLPSIGDSPKGLLLSGQLAQLSSFGSMGGAQLTSGEGDLLGLLKKVRDGLSTLLSASRNGQSPLGAASIDENAMRFQTEKHLSKQVLTSNPRVMEQSIYALSELGVASRIVERSYGEKGLLGKIGQAFQLSSGDGNISRTGGESVSPQQLPNQGGREVQASVLNQTRPIRRQYPSERPQRVEYEKRKREEEPKKQQGSMLKNFMQRIKEKIVKLFLG